MHIVMPHFNSLIYMYYTNEVMDSYEYSYLVTTLLKNIVHITGLRNMYHGFATFLLTLACSYNAYVSVLKAVQIATVAITNGLTVL